MPCPGMADMTDLSLNRRAYACVRRMVAEAETLGIAVHTLPDGAQVLDCGVRVPGGLEAGRRLAEACMGGLGDVVLTWQTWGDEAWPAVTVWTDRPAEACLAAQYAGWAVRHGDYFAMGSGPARALVRAETALYERLDYRESSDVAVLCLETRSLPTVDVADFIARRAGVDPSRLVLLVVPTASVAGSVQVAARSVETALHKLHVLGFDVRRVLHGMGVCPLPPPAEDDAHAIGRTNDAVLYGGRVYLTVRADDAELEALVPRLPSSASPDYGRPLYEVLKGRDFDFYRIDPLLFSPAEVVVTNVATGRTFRAGQVDPAVLKRSFSLGPGPGGLSLQVPEVGGRERAPMEGGRYEDAVHAQGLKRAEVLDVSDAAAREEGEVGVPAADLGQEGRVGAGLGADPGQVEDEDLGPS